MMKLYKCIVKYGHSGSGRYVEKKYYVRASDITSAMTKAKHLGGVKKGHLSRSGASILAISTV